MADSSPDLYRPSRFLLSRGLNNDIFPFLRTHLDLEMLTGFRTPCIYVCMKWSVIDVLPDNDSFLLIIYWFSQMNCRAWHFFDPLYCVIHFPMPRNFFRELKRYSITLKSQIDCSFSEVDGKTCPICWHRQWVHGMLCQKYLKNIELKSIIREIFAERGTLYILAKEN
jgi:hypothetical protein